MAAQITSALSQGFTAQQVLNFLIRQFPNQSKKIQKAISAGFSAEQVIKYLSGGRKELNSGEMATEHARTRSKDIERREAVTRGALTGGAIAGLGAGAAFGAPMAAQALQRAAPGAMNVLQRAAPQIFGPGSILQGSAPTQTQLPQVQPPLGNLGTQVQSPPISSQQPPINTPNLPQINELIPEGSFLKTKINELLRTKNSPEAIAAYFKKFHPKEVDKLEKQAAGQPIEKIIGDYVGTIPPEENKKELSREEALGAYRNHILIKHAQEALAKEKPKDILKVGQEINTRKGKAILTHLDDKTFEYKTENGTIRSGPRDSLNNDLIDIEKESPKEEMKIERGSTVASPQGVGEIKEIRNGKAIVDVNGKKHQVNEDELISSPLPEKDMADLFDEMIESIEKTTGKAVSRNVDWAGYDPTANELAYKPHGSDKMYVYEDIPEEEVDLLTNFLTKRKSTGENFVGAWESGSESPIGAAMYQLIKKLQGERGKGKEFKGKFETIYDLLEPVKELKKKKHAERKKREREEAKKPRLD